MLFFIVAVRRLTSEFLCSPAAAAEPMHGVVMAPVIRRQACALKRRRPVQLSMLCKYILTRPRRCYRLYCESNRTLHTNRTELVRRPNSTGVGAQTTLGGKTFFARKLCMKN